MEPYFNEKRKGERMLPRKRSCHINNTYQVIYNSQGYSIDWATSYLFLTAHLSLATADGNLYSFRGLFTLSRIPVCREANIPESTVSQGKEDVADSKVTAQGTVKLP